MRHIEVSTDVFAQIWRLRKEGEDSEDAILRRVLRPENFSAKSRISQLSSSHDGLHDRRFGVLFPEGFRIERAYLGQNFQASIQNGHWVIDGISGRFARLSELSRAIGTRNENAWINWFWVDADGQRRPVSDLRDQTRVSRRRREKSGKTAQFSVTTSAGRKARWCDDVRAALLASGGTAHLSQIYQKVRDIRRAAGQSTPKSLEAVIRKELEMRSSDSDAYDAARGEDWFEMAQGRGSGVWALR